MTSVVRIKRRLSQEPAEALLLHSKRLRVDEAPKAAVPATQDNVFRFCGTTENEKGSVKDIAILVEKGKLMSHRHKQKCRGNVSKKHIVPSASSSSEKKYKVLNTLRNLDNESDVKIYDLVLENEGQVKPEIPTCNGVPLLVEKCELPKEDVKYVYDIYYSDNGALIDDSYIDSLMSVQPYYYHPEEHEESEEDVSDEDSNDENHYGNEYPSTEEDEEGDDDLVGKMCGMYMGGNHELSSDDEDFIYSKNDDDFPHGIAYSRYKKRATKDLLGCSSESDENEGESDELPEESFD